MRLLKLDRNFKLIAIAMATVLGLALVVWASSDVVRAATPIAPEIRLGAADGGLVSTWSKDRLWP
jgi:hypothetical protein